VERVVAVLLTLLIALIGADRINLLAGAVGFIVTPFLVLTPLIVVAEALRLGATRARIRIPTQAAFYFLTATALVCVIGVSALLSQDPVISGRRTVLLLVQVHGALLLAILLLNRPRPSLILVRGAYLGLVIATVFNVLQLYFWVTGQWNPSQPETELLVNLTPRTYGPWLPRLSGTVIDQGRAALVLVFYVFIIFLFAARSRLRTMMLWIGVVSLLGTLSRAGVLCGLAAAGIYWLYERRLRLGWSQVFLASGACAAMVVLAMFLPLASPENLATLAPLGDRVSIDEGSSRLHLALIEHGLLVATSSFRNALLGIGYGNALMVLEEFFPGDRYANFHSLYVTLLAESGVFALVLGVWLLGYPFLLRWGPFLPLVAGFMVYNVFYQSTTEPAFWLILALSWLTAGMGRNGLDPGGDSRGGGEGFAGRSGLELARP
jgi:hypothetical protein